MTTSEYAEKFGKSLKAVQAQLRRKGELPFVTCKRVNKDWLLTEIVNSNGSEVTNGPEVVNLEAKPVNSVNFEHFKVDDRFLEHGRGKPVDGMVRVCFDPSDPDNDRMVSEETWRARLGFKCPHGFMGWSCTDCLNGIDRPVKVNRLEEQWAARLDKEFGPLMDSGQVRNGVMLKARKNNTYAFKK